ncbi:MAG TPA: hypothetical protein PLS56_02435 [Candidatus Dojkabacteria bacterium]|jgi:hypothetical protein|nr:hypothetical protein [Candidatus Dojkabacteria bacterium]
MKKIQEHKRLQTIGICCLVVVASVMLLYNFVLKDKRNEEKTNTAVEADAKRFAEEYPGVGQDNMFVYKSIDEVIDILENGTGVVYLGFPECKWCQAYVKYLYAVAVEQNIDTIYYTNILADRKNNTEQYQKLVEILKDYLLKDEEGNPRIYVPDVTVVSNGEILGHDNETSVITSADSGTPQEYWNEEKVQNLKEKLREMFQKLQSNTCTSCEV